MTIYYRPLGLVFGPDARRLRSDGSAGALAGMDHIGFTLVERIVRSGQKVTREIVPYSDLVNEKAVADITRPRGSFGGVDLSAARIMGVVNVTPDSFSDGGKLAGPDAAIVHGNRLAAEGADILDVGGESTRPGSEPVSLEDELRRVLPVIAMLSFDYPVSIDTRKARVMHEGAAAGARMINDVSALTHDPESAATVLAEGLPVILMHAQGEPKTMQLNPRYDDVLLDVYDRLGALVEAAVAAGIAREKICIDPGIGFGKTFRQNLDLLQGLTIFHGLGVPLLVGLSRKAFVGALTGEKVAGNRVHGSVGGALQVAMMGAHILRVHDVKATREALSTFVGMIDPQSADI